MALGARPCSRWQAGTAAVLCDMLIIFVRVDVLVRSSAVRSSRTVGEPAELVVEPSELTLQIGKEATVEAAVKNADGEVVEARVGCRLEIVISRPPSPRGLDPTQPCQSRRGSCERSPTCPAVCQEPEQAFTICMVRTASMELATGTGTARLAPAHRISKSEFESKIKQLSILSRTDAIASSVSTEVPWVGSGPEFLISGAPPIEPTRR